MADGAPSVTLAALRARPYAHLVPEGDHELWEYAARNRADIDTHAKEIERLRERYHELSAELSALRHLGNAVKDMAGELHALTETVGTLARRMVEKPTVRVMGPVSAWVAVVVAVTALVISATR